MKKSESISSVVSSFAKALWQFHCQYSYAHSMQTVFSLRELEGMMLANGKAIQSASNAVESAALRYQNSPAIPNPAALRF
jgi:hypothetical protein